MFQKGLPYIKPIERKKADATLKMSIEMLEEWFSVNYFKSNSQGKEVFKKHIAGTLRKIRKIRQIPAHQLYENKKDKNAYQQQNKLIEETYRALKELRLIFSTHPLSKSVEIPTQLLDESKIVIY